MRNISTTVCVHTQFFQGFSLWMLAVLLTPETTFAADIIHSEKLEFAHEGQHQETPDGKKRKR